MVGLFIALICIAFIIRAIIYGISMVRLNAYYESGIFPPFLKYSRDHLLEAYLSLAAKTIQQDRKDYREKIAYLSDYFNRYFPESVYNFSDSLSYSFQHPVKEESVAKWINKHVKIKSEKTQVLYFLCGMCIVDGDIQHRELKLLKNTAHNLNISPKELNSILAMYRKNYYDSTTKPTSPRDRSKKLAYEVLGVAENASMDEIKKAYRKLVKINHPDRQINQSESHKKIARERFIQIQKAYELIEELN